MNPRSEAAAPTGINSIGDFSGNIPVKLTKEELTELSKLNPFLSWLHIAAEWGAIVATIYLCERYWSPLLYILAVAIIGARQHALLILMHDGVHYRLFRNRRLNDFVSEVVLAWPHLVAAGPYRKNHIAHHRYLNSEKDPDWKRKQNDPAWIFPKPASDLGRLLFRDVSGLNAFALIKVAATDGWPRDTVNTTFLLARYGFYAARSTLIIYLGRAQRLCYLLVDSAIHMAGYDHASAKYRRAFRDRKRRRRIRADPLHTCGVAREDFSGSEKRELPSRTSLLSERAVLSAAEVARAAALKAGIQRGGSLDGIVLGSDARERRGQIARGDY